MSISPTDQARLMSRFPHIELSYETIPHMKVSPDYNICLAIPHGKKCFLWYTYNKEVDVCLLLDLNRDKRVSKMSWLNTATFVQPMAFGTLLYGTVVECENSLLRYFVIEDIYYYQGISLQYLPFGDRLGHIEKYLIAMKEHNDTNMANCHLRVVLPVMWGISSDESYFCKYAIPEKMIQTQIGYHIHHIQYRCLSTIAPYMNVNRNMSSPIIHENIIKPSIITKPTIPSISPILQDVRMNLGKQQYRAPAVFMVRAGIKYDIYHLYCYGKHARPLIYYGVAYIPNYNTSVFMNGIFRQIRENVNIDAIEESDDEDEFENTHEDKWVDLEKEVAMECIFHSKFKKWVPKRVIVDPHPKIVNISTL
jgi:hypothetical protein